MQATREKLHAAAKQLFFKHGWEGTTALAIRQQAGVSQGSWAHAFPKGKQDIGAAIYRELFEVIWGPVLKELHHGGPATACIRAAMEMLASQTETRKSSALLLLQLEEALLQTERREHVRAARAKILQAFRELASRHGAKGTAQKPGAALHASTFGPVEILCREWLHGVHEESPRRHLAGLLPPVARDGKSPVSDKEEQPKQDTLSL